MTLPALDHAVISVRDRMDEAVATYRKLGFFLTERGYHTLGSINHLAVFADSYLELIGFEPGAQTVRADIMAQPVGLNALVLAMDDPATVGDALRANGVAVDPPLDFSRPVEIDGARRDARFRTLRLAGAPPLFGRLYFCQHLTRDLVWRDAWRAHPNGATAIARMVISTSDPRRSAAYVARMFGWGALGEIADGLALTLPNARIEFIAEAALARRYGDALPDPAGRDEYLAVLSIVTLSLDRAASTLRQGGIGAAARAGGLAVPAAAAMNVCLEFIAS